MVPTARRYENTSLRAVRAMQSMCCGIPWKHHHQDSLSSPPLREHPKLSQSGLKRPRSRRAGSHGPTVGAPELEALEMASKALMTISRFILPL